uniref:Secreted protein n=1 Tax=Ascaris lumbricoides TaxID=6252 RepID=A0A0M3IA44_ASCLU
MRCTFLVALLAIANSSADRRHLIDDSSSSDESYGSRYYGDGRLLSFPWLNIS